MRLDLSWADRKGTSAVQTRRFLEFQVDGRPFSAVHKQDLISCLGWFVPEQDDLAARRLLGEVPPDVEDRVALCVCPECGDIVCGALTARIAYSEREVVWSDFAFSWFDSETDRWQHDPADIAGDAEYRFDADAYRQTITERPQAPRR